MHKTILLLIAYIINIIKEWVKMDDEIMKIQMELKKRKDHKKKISENLTISFFVLLTSF